MYPFRAVEHRVAVVLRREHRVLGFIAPSGKIVRRVPLLRADHGDRAGAAPDAVRCTRAGDWVAYLSLAVSGALLALHAWKRVA